MPLLDPSHPLARGLVLACPFSEGSGLSLYDLSGLGNNLALVNGPTWAAGGRGTAVAFDGTNDYAACTDAASRNTLDVGTGDYSVAFGFKSNGTSNGTIVISKDSSYGTAPLWFVSFNYGGNIGLLYFSIRDNATTVTSGNSSARYDDSAWHDVVFVLNRSGNGILYVDGVAVVTASIAGATGNLSNTADLRVCGRDIAGDEAFFAGSFDHVLVYNRALSVAEVVMLHMDPFAMFRRPTYDWLTAAGGGGGGTSGTITSMLHLMGVG